VKSNPKLDFI